jgi:hypothetical protein
MLEEVRLDGRGGAEVWLGIGLETRAGDCRLGVGLTGD